MSIPGLPAGARHLLADGLGSTLGLLDPSATPTTAYTYEPFGRTTSTGAFSANSARFTGREDDGTGLSYYRARYYSPQLQRFISEDPIRFAGGDANLHAYVGNDPVNLTDPSGENPFLAACAGGAALDALVYVALNGRKTTASGVAGAAASGCVGGIVGLGIGRLAGAVLPKVMGAIRRSRIANTCKFNSFSADTDVATEQGPRRIDSIRVGDRVLAYDEETGETASQLVTATWGHQDPVVVQVRVGDEQLVATPDHPFMVVGRGWVKASDLRPGDRISRAFGGTGPVIEVTVARQPQVMYNLTVDTAHTYFVGDAAWLVHNANQSGREGKQARLRELVDDPKLSRSLRGWIRSELNQIVRGRRTRIRVPQGMVLAHRRGYEARNGFGYEYSDLQERNLHRLQHRHEGYRVRPNTPPAPRPPLPLPC